jgi:hypothetical protein
LEVFVMGFYPVNIDRNLHLRSPTFISLQFDIDNFILILASLTMPYKWNDQWDKIVIFPFVIKEV